MLDWLYLFQIILIIWQLKNIYIDAVYELNLYLYVLSIDKFFMYVTQFSSCYVIYVVNVCYVP
jgi:hypothetical protein